MDRQERLERACRAGGARRERRGSAGRRFRGRAGAERGDTNCVVLAVWHDHFSFVTEFFSDIFLPRPEQERRSKASKAPVLSAPGLGLSADPAAGTANP